MIRVVVLIGDREYPGRSPGYVAPHGVSCPECGADLLVRVVCRVRERDARCEECDAIVGRIIPRVRRSRHGLVSA